MSSYHDTKTTIQRDKGTYFEHIIQDFLRFEPHYQTLYQDVLTYAQWMEQYKPNERKNDVGIDLVAIGFDGTLTAIQCKNYSTDYHIQKSDIDSFFTASGKKDFSHRLIVTTTQYWSKNAEESLENQHIPVSIIDRIALENSVIDWGKYTPTQTPILQIKKALRQHQEQAVKSVAKGFETQERGKLIMACGTGKTFTSLKIAEKEAGVGKTVLFLVPSLALLSQSLTEWTQQSDIKISAFAVCSDSDVGKNHQDDLIQSKIYELQYPATTNSQALYSALQKSQNKNNAMTVIFSTYHSIEVIHQAQKLGLQEFDLVICDEAHRTTGATFVGNDESHFVKIHHNDFIRAKKRLYMTATPRIYDSSAKKNDEVEVYSMDDVNIFGETFYTISFSTAVHQELLVDYKVIVLAVSESHINYQLQDLLNSSDNEYQVDDVAKIVGCWKALSKYGVEEDLSDDYQPMKRAVAFCQVIEKNYKGNKHKVSSKAITEMFSEVVSTYQAQEIAYLKSKNKNAELNPSLQLKCEAKHIDGSMNASQKNTQINWLKQETDENICRILSNVRCLSEGVDVPALDAVLFLTARNSQIDVVQSVGRVMRKAEGKKRGYVILPIVIPAGVEPHEALENNENYKVVWQVLNALRSHDDRFDAMLNKLEFGAAHDKIEVVALAELGKNKTKSANKKTKRGTSSIGNKEPILPVQEELDFSVGDLERALIAKIVKKCGNRMHWQEWAENVAKIANTHIDRIKAILENPNNQTQITAFNQFANQLRQDLNEQTSDNEAIDMLAQHLITKPIFDALFSESEFAKFNPMSIALDKVIEALALTNISDKETKELNEFYDAIAIRVSGIKEPAHCQRIIKELYDNFFRTAFPKLAEKMGIVYTPIEVVDFIIHSVEHILQTEFNSSLSDKGVQIIDPFTGTGTFITRLLQSGIIPTNQLPQKYQEIHANEMLLLAYYIAAINIESVYHSLIIDDYKPFTGICLADTFAMYENDLVSHSDNSERQKRQKELDITVIIGNPPYSAGQTSENDNNKNIKYRYLDSRIESTYVKFSNAGLKRNMYDPYTRAIRWASDRIGNQGVIGFITNSGFIDSKSADGLRQCLSNEFSSLYIFNLRGDIRAKAGDIAKKEGQNIFNIITGVAISILVKNPTSKNNAQIYYYDIGDYLTRPDKLSIIENLKSIGNISWEQIVPNLYQDWINQRDENNNFDDYISSCGESSSVFVSTSSGVVTSRDSWVCNCSKSQLSEVVKNCIDFYNLELNRYHNSDKTIELSDFIDSNPQKISWSRALKNNLHKGKKAIFDSKNIRKILHKPFFTQNIYFDKMFNEVQYQLPKLFPTENHENIIIFVKNRWKKQGFLSIVSNKIMEYQTDGGGVLLPLYLYENDKNGNYTQKSAISDEALAHFKEFYHGAEISKENIFYYIYGLLHSPEYRERYADNLSKQLPRIPRVKLVDDFWVFEQAGRALAELHLYYENVPMYADIKLQGGIILQNDNITGAKNEDFYVTKMKFAKRKNAETGKNEDDKTVIIYNDNFTVSNIPLQAYDYIVNGKSAIEWVMERQSVKTDKASGIVNDANDWAIETMNNAKYPLELLLRVIKVSMETMKIVNDLPALDI